MTAVYVHIPYCISKCPYCDFGSVPVDDSVGPYFDALTREIADAARKRQAADTIYVGGGTPTTLTSAQIEMLLDCLRGNFTVAANAEITVEANPCSLTREKVEAFVAGGVNRVSLGAQTFIDEELRFLGRSHVEGDIRRSLALLREGGIENISLDLIFAIPGQSQESWRHSLHQTVELKPVHISAYCLTFEPGTPFWHALQAGKMEKKSDDEETEFYDIGREILLDAGYEHYEISNFARPGKRSLHNMAYWLNKEYVGLGANAVSYLDGRRIHNQREPADYIAAMTMRGTAMCETETIPLQMQAIETIIQRLRLKEGVDCLTFSERFGLQPMAVFGDSYDYLIGLGLIERTPDGIRSTVKGWRLANEVALRALP